MLKPPPVKTEYKEMHRLYTGGAFLYIFYRAKSTARYAFEFFVQAISIANVWAISRYVSLLPKRRQTHRIQHHKHRTKRHCRTRNHRVQQARHGDRNSHRIVGERPE